MMRSLAYGLLILFSLASWADTPPSSTPTLFPEPAAAYDETRYLLAYNIYLASGKLQAAYGVAHKAITLHPADRAWLQRFVQVARWVGDGPGALSALLRLSVLQHLDEATWQQIGQMAIQLDNDQARLAMQLHEIEVFGASHERVQAAIASYEHLGDIDTCIAWLIKLNQQQPDPWWLEQASQLAEREGNTTESIALTHALLHQFPAQPQWLVSLATLDYGNGDVAAAVHELQAYRQQMPPEAKAYWEVLADFSHLLGQDQLSLQAYQVLITSGQASDLDMDNAVNLLSAQDTLAAAKLSTLNEQLHPSDVRLLNALYLNNQVRHFDINQHLIKHLSVADHDRLTKNPEFLSLRATFNQALGYSHEAVLDLEHAVQLAPEQERYLAELIDAFIIAQDWDKLRSWLIKGSLYTQHHPGLWITWADAWLTLQSPQNSLPWLQAWVRSHPDDLHARLKLADALENLDHASQATSIRRRLFFEADIHRLTPDEMLELRWQVASASGSEDAYYKSLLHSLQQGTTQQKHVILEHLIDNQIQRGASDAQLQSAQFLPLSLQTYRALNNNDLSAMPDLLQKNDLALSDRQALLMASGSRDAAAEELMRRSWLNPDNSDLTEEWAPLLDHATAVSTGLEDNQIGILVQHKREIGTSWPLDASRRMELAWSDTDQFSKDTTKLLQPPRQQSLAIRYVEDFLRGQASLAWIPTVNAGRYAEVDSDVQYPWTSRLNIEGQLNYHEPANENEILIALGQRDQARLTTTYTLAPSWQLQGSLHENHYGTQTGDNLGYGSEWDMLLNNSELSPLDFSLEYTQFLFQAENHPLDALLSSYIPKGSLQSTSGILPQGFNQWSLNAHWEGQPTELRHWRVVADAALLYISSAGRGYSGHLALAGPVWGRDELMLDIEQERSGVAQGSLVRTLAVKYRYDY
ncbi:MAG: tetratricopeptide repeat protein [Pseudomonadales bacterium]|nr:tetratricopeptide repeat protein [Pseudomonadales bacterium]